jgi:hypothetical protein
MFLVVWKLFSLNLGTEKRDFLIGEERGQKEEASLQSV